MKTQIYFTLLILFSFPLILISQSIDLVTFASGFNRPVDIKHANDSRLFVVEQDGIIKVVDDSGNVNTTPFLDISNITNSSGNEEGLLGLAFDPNYATNNRFYINYINNIGNTVIARYTTSTNPDIADASSAEILLTISQPFSNHNGGSMAFGNDGLLYIAIGDGGNGGDPGNRAQNLTLLLGKILRIDVSGASGYTIPATNPYVGNSNARDEIWAFGLRNPWKISFDSDNGELWIGDVGQSNREEINNVVINNSGYNFGWRCYEGTANFNTTGCPNLSDTTQPVAEYNYGGNPFKCSITGGYRYRGNNFPNLAGKYVFADYCSNEIGTLTPDGTSWSMEFTSPFSGNLSTFGEDANKELYVAALFSGIIYNIVDNDALHIDDESLETNFVIHPNPTKTSFKIDYGLENLKPKSIKIITLSGKTVSNFKFEASSQNFNIENLEKGIYIIEINLNNNKAYKKLIVN